jgi:glycosyltransferase involved in cell wall biosynthesis
MTICIATDSYPPHNSGIATHNSYLVKLLLDSGNKVIVLTASFDQPREEDLVIDQGDLVIITLKKSYGEQFNYYKKFFRSGTREAAVWISLGMAMRKWMTTNSEKYNIDVIEFSDYGGFGLFLVDSYLPPAVMMCHGMLTQLNKKEFHNQDENLAMIRFLESNAARLSDAVICHSHTNAEELANEWKIKTNYVTAPWFNDSIQEAPVTRHEFIIASRLQVCKGALVIANALQSLHKDYPRLKIHWYGDDTYTAPGGWLVSKYLKKHFPKIWQHSFIWKKSVPRKQLLEEIAASESIIIPSTWETFNYVALEGANRKKAMIISKQAGISSVINPAGNYLSIDANDAHSVKTAIIKLHTEKEMVKSLGESLAATVPDIFNKINFNNDRKRVYDMAIEHRKNNRPVNPLESFFIPLR